MAARSTAHSATSESFTRIDGVERTIRAFNETLHARFSLRQFIGRRTKIFDSLLEQRQRARELDVVTLQLGGNLLEPTQPLLELHAESRGRTCAGTTPSRTMRSNGMSARNAETELNVAPFAPRAIA